MLISVIMGSKYWATVPRKHSIALAAIDRAVVNILLDDDRGWTGIVSVASALAEILPASTLDNNNDIQQVLKERGNTYGSFTDNAAMSQQCKRALHDCRTWHKLLDVEREALEMIAHKVSRIVNGDADYADSWVDIAGYAQLVIDTTPVRAFSVSEGVSDVIRNLRIGVCATCSHVTLTNEISVHTDNQQCIECKLSDITRSSNKPPHKGV